MKLEEIREKPFNQRTVDEHILMCNAEEAAVTDDEFFIALFEERLNDEWEE